MIAQSQLDIDVALHKRHIVTQNHPLVYNSVHHIPNGLVAMISACHSHRQVAGDQGSIPC